MEKLTTEAPVGDAPVSDAPARVSRREGGCRGRRAGKKAGGRQRASVKGHVKQGELPAGQAGRARKAGCWPEGLHASACPCLLTQRRRRPGLRANQRAEVLAPDWIDVAGAGRGRRISARRHSSLPGHARRRHVNHKCERQRRQRGGQAQADGEFVRVAGALHGRPHRPRPGVYVAPLWHDRLGMLPLVRGRPVHAPAAGQHAARRSARRQRPALLPLGRPARAGAGLGARLVRGEPAARRLTSAAPGWRRLRGLGRGV